jgi:sarcosine oxidase
MTTRLHTIVVGLGEMGSAAVYQLAKRGQHVLGIDRFSPPHPFGSTHGETRITRQAIGEGVHYTPLAVRSQELWREIERATGRRLLTETGGLMISSPGTAASVHVADFFATTLAAATAYDIPHEILSAQQIRARFPPFNVQDDEIGYFEPHAGFVRPEACVRAQLELAEGHGATLHFGERVLTVHQDRAQVVVRTDAGAYVAEHVIAALGPWLPAFLPPEVAHYFAVTRQVLLWFAPKASVTPFLPAHFPVFIWQPHGLTQSIYGFPALDGAQEGIKVASAQYGETTTAETVTRAVTAEEIAAVYARLVAPCFPGLSSQCLKAMSCLYTVTPDAGFVIDRHPEYRSVWLVSPCSGHGFKHSAAIGEALAELVVHGTSRHDLSHFTIARLDAGRGCWALRRAHRQRRRSPPQGRTLTR